MGIQRPAPDASAYLPEETEEEIAPAVRRSEPARVARPVSLEGRVPSRDVSAPRNLPAQGDSPEDRPLPPPKTARSRPHERWIEVEGLEDEDPDVQVPASSRIAAGWGAAKTLQSEGGDYTTEFKMTEEPVLVKFLSDEPFASYRQHFLREKESGKKSFVCLGPGCPLCDDLGHSPDKKFAFTIVDLTQRPYTATMLVAGPRLLGTLEKNNNGKSGPLSTHYWEMSRTGSGLKTDYTMSVVKDRYLKEDHDLDPITVTREMARIKPFDATAIHQTSAADLRQIVSDLDS